ncbi:MAG TPA: hypothetical protein H9699_08595 [Candidatus Gemmiger stercoravium]|nr:hypothetical protein [Candidatus Gemmiger stercoravium]
MKLRPCAKFSHFPHLPRALRQTGQPVAGKNERRQDRKGIGKEKDERFRIVKKAELGTVKKIIRPAAAHKGNGAVTGRRSPEQAQPFLCGLPLTSRTFIVYASFRFAFCLYPTMTAGRREVPFGS